MDFEKFCRENCVERRGTGTLKWDSLQEILGMGTCFRFGWLIWRYSPRLLSGRR